MNLPDRLMFVDVETTGVASHDRVVSLGLVQIDTNALKAGRLEASYGHWIFDPGRNSHPRAAEVHGYSDWLLRHQDPFEALAAELLPFFAESGLVVAHNASFDQRFIAAEFERAGKPIPARPFFCTIQEYRRRIGGPSGLAAILPRLGLARAQNTHGALEDAWLAMEVFLWLHDLPRPPAGTMPRIGPTNLKEAPPLPAGPLPRRSKRKKPATADAATTTPEPAQKATDTPAEAVHAAEPPVATLTPQAPAAAPLEPASAAPAAPGGAIDAEPVAALPTTPEPAQKATDTPAEAAHAAEPPVVTISPQAPAAAPLEQAPAAPEAPGAAIEPEAEPVAGPLPTAEERERILKVTRPTAALILWIARADGYSDENEIAVMADYIGSEMERLGLPRNAAFEQDLAAEFFDLEPTPELVDAAARVVARDRGAAARLPGWLRQVTHADGEMSLAERRAIARISEAFARARAMG
jgi:DNA polymerase-3 subunit epsilon